MLNERDLNSIIITILYNKKIDRHLLMLLLQEEEQDSRQQRAAYFFESARVSRKMIANVRQFTNVLIKLIPQDPYYQFFKGERITLGASQIIAEFFELLGLFRKQKQHFTTKDATKILCNIVGTIALTITIFGISSIPVIAAANALRGITNFLKLLIRQIENKRKLANVTNELERLSVQLQDPQFLALLSFAEKTALCKEYFRLSHEHIKLTRLVQSLIITFSERITLAANLLLIAGSVMSFFPVTAPLGLLFITISAATRFLAGIAPIIEEFKSPQNIVESCARENEISPPYILIRT